MRATTEFTNTRIMLESRPVGAPEFDDFRIETTPVAAPADGEVLLRTIYLSLDPYMRGRMSDAKSYAEPVKVGDVMEGGTVSEVVESRHPDFVPGEFVLSHCGWQSYAVVPGGRHLRKLDPTKAPISTAVGVLGMPGFTAYAGLLAIGRPQPGETVAVAAATGPVGSMVGQIAKVRGARSVGIAGGAEKIAYLKDLGFDAVVDHRSDTFVGDLKAATPDGVDVYFENVGGAVQEAVWPRLNPHARVPVCGLVAHYNEVDGAAGPNRLPRTMSSILTKSLTIRGFIQNEFVREYFKDFQRDVTTWLAEDHIRYREDIVAGLENAPEAFIGLLAGRNFGKLLIRVAPDPSRR